MIASRSLRILGVLAVAFAAMGTTRFTHKPKTAKWRQQFAQAALQIPFDEDRAPERDSALGQALGLPTSVRNVRIASARTSDTAATARIEARITTDSGYRPLGLAPGVNYVWKDYARGQMRLLIIPADTGWKEHWLVVRSHVHPPTVRVPRLFWKPPSVGAPQTRALMCYCTSGCPVPWCQACDTSHRVAVTAELPLKSIGRYFRNNRVAWAER